MVQGNSVSGTPAVAPFQDIWLAHLGGTMSVEEPGGSGAVTAADISATNLPPSLLAQVDGAPGRVAPGTCTHP